MYYQVNFSRVGSIENEIAEYGLFDVQLQTLSVKTGAITTTGTKIYNPGTVEALPRMSIYGEVTIDINGRDFIVTPAVTVDSELGYAYINLGGFTHRRWPELLDVGENTAGRESKIDIIQGGIYDYNLR